MYPQEELKRLAGTRALLQRRIAAQRRQIGDAADGLARPLRCAGALWTGWKSAAPWLDLGRRWFRPAPTRRRPWQRVLAAVPTVLELFRRFRRPTSA